jgi:hypothetical protein
MHDAGKFFMPQLFTSLSFGTGYGETWLVRLCTVCMAARIGHLEPEALSSTGMSKIVAGERRQDAPTLATPCSCPLEFTLGSFLSPTFGCSRRR